MFMSIGNHVKIGGKEKINKEVDQVKGKYIAWLKSMFS
jgi:hypothetical protein